MQRRRWRNLVLIAVTGGEASSDTRVARTFELVDHHVRKPVDLKTLSSFMPPVQ